MREHLLEGRENEEMENSKESLRKYVISLGKPTSKRSTTENGRNSEKKIIKY